MTRDCECEFTFVFEFMVTVWMRPSRCEQSLRRVSQTTDNLMRHIGGRTCAGCPLGGGAWESASRSADCPLHRRNNKHKLWTQRQELHETESVSASQPRDVSPPLNLDSRLTLWPWILSEASLLFFWVKMDQSAGRGGGNKGTRV